MTQAAIKAARKIADGIDGYAKLSGSNAIVDRALIVEIIDGKFERLITAARGVLFAPLNENKKELRAALKEVCGKAGV